MTYVTEPMSADRLTWLQDKMAVHVAEAPRYKDLITVLLSHGGEALSDCPEVHLEQILTRGELQDGEGAAQRRGQPSNCHENSALLWKNDESGKTQLWTGWALSADGCWRQHSWARKGKKIQETTVLRLAYFGFQLEGEEAELFYKQNH